MAFSVKNNSGGVPVSEIHTTRNLDFQLSSSSKVETVGHVVYCKFSAFVYQ